MFAMRAATLFGLAVLVVSACGAIPAPPTASASALPTTAPGSASQAVATAPPQQVVAGPFELEVPAGWHVRQALPNPSGNWTLDYLGPGQLPSECEGRAGGGGVCHPWPIVQLDPGGSVIAVRQYGMPGSRPPTGGDPVMVAGLSGRRTDGPASVSCLAIGGSASIAVAIPTVAGSQGWLSLEACLAGPDVAPTEAAFSAIVASATVTAAPSP